MDDPGLIHPGDAIVQVRRAAVCGSDLWWFRGLNPREAGTRVGHEFIGSVVEVGSAVTSLRVGDFVVAPFMFSDNTCAACSDGWTSSCANGGVWGGGENDGGQGEYVRVPHAEGTLVRVGARDEEPAPDALPSLLALTDVMPTGHHAARSAGVTSGSTVAVIGDGAVGLCAVIAAVRLGAGRVIALSSHDDRAALASNIGASDVRSQRGTDAIEAVRESTAGRGADAVLECVGSSESFASALGMVRDGGRIGYVGLPHDAVIDLASTFRRNVSVAGGLAPARHYIPELLPAVLDGTIDPGRMFTRTLDLRDVQRGYEAMDAREDVKVMLEVG